jgi:queuosine precursor transporter
MKLDARLTLFVTLVAVFVTCLVVGDITGGKVTSLHLFGHEWPFSAGQLAFPVTFILTDILNEFYGQAVTRKVTYLAFAMVALTFGIIYASGALPWWSVTLTPGWTGVAFHFIKKITGNRWLVLRATGSTAISQLVDTFLITALVWGTKISFNQYLSFVATSYVIKLLISVVVTPVIYGLHNVLEHRFDIKPVDGDGDPAVEIPTAKIN